MTQQTDIILRPNSKPSLWSRVRNFFNPYSTELAAQRPRPLPANVPTGVQWVFDQSLERSLERGSAGAVIQQIIGAYDSAELGDVESMVDLFERRMEADAHMRAAFDNRNEAVSQKPWTIEPGGDSDADAEAAEALEIRLRDVANFMQTLEHQLTFNPFGFAGSEIQWDIVDGMAAPAWFDNVGHRRFGFEQETDRPMLRTLQNPFPGEPLRPGKWWFTCRRGRLIAMSGLMRSCLWWSTYKILGTRDWLVYMDRFGLPFVTGEYDEDIAPADRDALKKAVQDIGTDGFAIFSKMAEIKIHEASRRQDATQSVHAALLQVCDNEVSFLVEGATLVSSVDGPGSHALGKVHQNRYFDILLGDAERLSQSFQHQIGVPFVAFNGLDARPPRLRLHLGLNMSLMDQIGMATKLANSVEGFDLSEKQLRRMTQLNKPANGDALRGLEFAKLEGEVEEPGTQPIEDDSSSEE